MVLSMGRGIQANRIDRKIKIHSSNFIPIQGESIVGKLVFGVNHKHHLPLLLSQAEKAFKNYW
jgi:hypothetical protein